MGVLVKKLNKIAETVYCQLKPSKYHGVGVFAVRAIPKGAEPFEGGSGRSERFYRLKISELRKLPAYFVDLIKNYSIQEADFYWISLGSWNTYSLQDFLNHSDTPNMELWRGDRFRTVRAIKKGEELIVNYKTFDASWREKLSRAKVKK